MNVLSLFDGISCGQVALERAGIKYNSYFASEIDKYAIQITHKNYPNTINVGDVQFVTGQQFSAIGGIDLLIGGSPCQGFSFAGKQLNFKDPRSALFFEFVRLKRELNPKWFLLENVKMKKEYQDVISEYLGVQPIEINSSIVSAQNRKRLYWTNIPIVKQPEDKGILLKDILEEEVDNKYYFHDRIGNSITGKNSLNKIRVSLREKCQKSRCLTAAGQSVSNAGSTNIIEYIKCSKDLNVKKYQDKASTLAGGAHSGGNIEQNLEPRFDNKINSLTTVQKDNMLLNDYSIRRLTPIECERLQTLPDNYTEGVSDTQRYKALGNGWTVDVIAHIFKNIK